ncbi:hypothetical protein [Campylobacter sp. RM12651]|uniref:hypothetical protein n=1 Tax=Campylobacter sp. RM12651 TaxID=1660079 RepID=UPI001EFB3A9F|nr:hypothetical protein [Campylobacter sp. RM12651]ULO04574.1 hypothetical protein AVBRAN_a0092 [Campylobacter sp. RM12651]
MKQELKTLIDKLDKISSLDEVKILFSHYHPILKEDEIIFILEHFLMDKYSIHFCHICNCEKRIFWISYIFKGIGDKTKILREYDNMIFFSSGYDLANFVIDELSNILKGDLNE